MLFVRQPASKLNHFKQSTQKDEQRKCYREEEGESRTQGHGDIWTWVLTELNRRQAEVPELGTGFFLNKMCRGNRIKFVMLYIFITSFTNVNSDYGIELH